MGETDDMGAALAAAEAARARMAVDARATTGSRIEPLGLLVARVAREALPVRAVRPVAPTDVQAARLRARNRALEQIPSARRWAEFGSADLVKRVSRRVAVEESRAAARQPRVVWLGPAGSGKTSLACAALREWVAVDGPRPVAFATSYELARARSKHALGAGEPEIIDRALDARLLVLDDLGEGEPAHGSAVAEVIYEREAHDRPTWITSWRDPSAVARLYGDGIARRVFERATIIDCGAP